MTNTTDLIATLAADARPVRRLEAPIYRTLLWIAASSLIVGLVVIAQGIRPDALAATGERLGWVASIVTSVLAAYAAFEVGIPGRGRAWRWLPVPAALAWIVALGAGCLHEVARDGVAALAFEFAGSQCALIIAMFALPLTLALLLMVRYARYARPGTTALLAMLSAASMASAGATLVHAGESAAMSLVWHGGAVLVLSLASWLSGSRLFAWLAPAPRRPAHD